MTASRRSDVATLQVHRYNETPMIAVEGPPGYERRGNELPKLLVRVSVRLPRRPRLSGSTDMKLIKM